jgi:triosephosphate isomerase
MRIPLLAGNWKMNKTVDESLEFVKESRERLDEVHQVEKAICVPYVAIPSLAAAIKGTSIKLGAQNMHWEDSGAFTGEISPLMLEGLAHMVIIGHSERRQYFAETDETVNKKVKAALAHNLTPILCVGESLDQNRAGETEAFVGGQVRAALNDISAADVEKLVVAYEPIWAIGTGLAATSEDANRIIGQVCRATLASLYGDATAQAVRILYGGSMNTKNVDELMHQPEVDGGLVGGASLKPDDYVTLVKVSAQAKGLH